jgi:modulator of FtsH protease
MKDNIRDLPYAAGATTIDTASTNKVLRNTYMLLALTVAFSAVCAVIGTAMEISSTVALVCMIASFGVLFWVHKAAESAQGLVAVFVFTGLLGFSLGHILNRYLGLANGSELIFQAMAGTALVFFGLSGYVLTTRKDFSFMRGFLTVGLIVMLVAMVVNLFLNIPLLTVAFPAFIVLLMSGLILFDTSRIIHGGETNYIRATVGLYLSLYNLFVSLLQLSGMFGGDE